MESAHFDYVMYVSTSPEKLFNALIDPKMTAQYWQHENVSDWKPGSNWEHRRSDDKGMIDLVGKVVEYNPPRRIVLSWADPADRDREEKYSRVTLEVEPYRGIARLTVTHDKLEPGSDMWEGITDGWPKVLSSLKSLIETGKALPELW
jgi:uncharacterized protein YndB with AHSA1/START domain